jgi:2-furoyl-CoA dehydrogenase large subunit
MLLDPKTLEKVVPGAHGIERVSDTHFRADVTLGVGPVKGRYKAEIRLSDLVPPQALTLSGEASGALGFGGGTGFVTLEEADGATTIRYRYEAGIGGKVASVGGRLLDGAARFLIAQFFAALAKQASGEAGVTSGGFFARVLAKLRRRA